MNISVRISASDLALFVLLALLTLLGYQFGAGHQTEQLPLIQRQLEPGFLAHDFYTNRASEFGPRYYYVQFVAWLASFWSLPAVILALTLIVNFSLAAVTYLGARDLLGSGRLAGHIAAVLAVTSSGFSLGLSPYLRFESFQPASPAIAIGLFALWRGMRGRPIEAALLAGVASLFHPLIGLESGALALGCAAVPLVLRRWADPPAGGDGGGAKAWFIGVLVLASMIYVLWLAPMPDPGGDALSSEEFYQLLAVFRAPHHYLPSAMPGAHYLAFIAFLASLVAIWAHWYRAGDPSRSHCGRDRAREVRALLVLVPVLAVVLACALSYVFIELVHSRLWVTSQPFRMLFVVKWIGFLLIGWWTARLFRSGDLRDGGLALLVLLSIADAQPVVLLLCLGAKLLLVRAPSDQSEPVRWGTFALLALIAFVLNWKVGMTTDSGALSEAYDPLVIGAALLCVSFLGRDDAARPRVVIVPAYLVAGLILLAWFNRSEQWLDLERLRPSFTIAGLQGPGADIARWARGATPEESIWLVPPEFRFFRIAAQRAVVVDFTCIPFGDGDMREWRERMLTSYGEVAGAGLVALAQMQRNHRELGPERASEVRARFGASHAVLYRDTEWPGEVLYANEDYKAVELPVLGPELVSGLEDAAGRLPAPRQP